MRISPFHPRSLSASFFFFLCLFASLCLFLLDSEALSEGPSVKVKSYVSDCTLASQRVFVCVCKGCQRNQSDGSVRSLPWGWREEKGRGEKGSGMEKGREGKDEIKGK